MAFLMSSYMTIKSEFGIDPKVTSGLTEHASLAVVLQLDLNSFL